MKHILLLFITITTIMQANAQTIYIKTNIGQIAIHSYNQKSEKIPIIFCMGFILTIIYGTIK